MSIIGLLCDRGFRTVDECLKCHSRCIILAPIAELQKKISSGYYMPREREYHVTSLLGCPRKAVLGRVCGEYARPINIWKMQMGTLGHEFMEKHPVGKGLAERLLKFNYYIPIDGETHKCLVVGKFDWYSMDDNMIHDYKFPWGLDFVPNDKHFRQLATYYIIGTGSGAFTEDDIVGAQVDYIDIANGGAHCPYVLSGKSFEDEVEFMRTYLIKMLKHYLMAEVKGVLPKGDPEQTECAYCSPDFRAHCKEGGNCRIESDDLQSVLISIKSYRKENTPPEIR